MPTPRTMLERAALNALRGPGRRIVLEAAREVARAAKAVAPPETPPTRRERLAESVVYGGWVVSLAALALVILNVDLLLGAGTPRGILRLSLGTVLLVEGVLLVSDWRRARARVLRRARRRHAFARAGRRWSGPVSSLVLTLVGLVLLGAGVLDLLRGALDL